MRICLISFLLILFPLMVSAQMTPCERATDVIFTLNKHHIQPKTLDDTFSELVFNHLIKSLDPENLIFCKEDLEKLESYKYQIDDLIRSKNCAFITDLNTTYKSGLFRLDSIYTSLATAQFDIFTADSLFFSGDEIRFSRSELPLFIKKLIQANSLYQAVQSGSKVELEISALFNEKVESIISSKQCEFQTKMNTASLNEFILNSYLSAICNAYDPHSSYFTESKKNSFRKALSDDALSFGFDLSPAEGGYIQVESIHPGGAVWKSNQITEGDVLLSVSSNNDFIDLKCISWEKFREFMENPNHHTATFSIQKKNQSIRTITITKEPLVIEENIIESFILSSKSKKIGYLYLPSFYGEIQNGAMTYHGCANDIAKELVKLKREGIDGLIFDLRDNPGGYIMEAMRLAGLFVDYGALGIAELKDQNLTTLKDPSRGISYDGPLLILVNEYSASASELFAAALQDHNRAIIAGSSTFGKATIQNIFPLENSAGQEIDDHFLKITQGFFHKVTGKSHQGMGVQSDIYIPTEYDLIQFKESDYTTSLSNKEISKKTYYFPLDELPLDELRKKSQSRLDTSAVFQNIFKAQNANFEEEKKSYHVPIYLEGLMNYNKEKNVLEELKSPNNIFTTEKPSYFTEKLNSENQNKLKYSYINEDESIKESFRILIDFIHLNQLKDD